MRRRDDRKRRIGRRAAVLCGLAAGLILLAALGVLLLRANRMKAGGAASSADPAELSYTGAPYAELDGNRPDFREEEKQTRTYARYSPLDELGRCGPAMACLGPETMPTRERGEIGTVRPSGWHTARYDDLIEDRYLYNRCHLIAYMLAGENDNPCNLITGTRYLNTQGMLPFEILVGDYIQRTGNHVLYRVSPVFRGDDLVAAGVRMEAWSVEDRGKGICFHVYVFNVQPGIEIDYRTGESRRAEEP